MGDSYLTKAKNQEGIDRGIDRAPTSVVDEPVVDFIMPVFNEGANIERALREVYDNVPLSKRVLVVYDFDEDDTVPVVLRIAGEFPGVELVKNTLGRGPLNAMRAGIAATRAEVVIITMADLSDDMSVAPRMVDLVANGPFDVVCASRYMRGGRQVGGPPLKGFLSRAAGISLYWLAGLPTHDATNSFRAYRRHVFDRIDIESVGGFELALEVTAKAHAERLRITEVPATWYDRTAGESQFKFYTWLPQYLKWYLFALLHQPRLRGKRAMSNRETSL